MNGRMSCVSCLPCTDDACMYFHVTSFLTTYKAPSFGDSHVYTYLCSPVLQVEKVTECSNHNVDPHTLPERFRTARVVP
jgi:hypothetical protein